MTNLSLPPTQNGYIQLPLTTSATQLQQQAFAAIAALFPGWLPSEGQLDTALIEQFALMAAETAAVAAQVPLVIFQYFGSLVGVPPETGAPATATTTWTMVDTQGYVVPAGTLVAYTVLGNQLIIFQTQTAFTVAAGSSTATGVAIVAQVAGSAGNGLATGTLELLTALSFVSSVVSTSISAGGADPESQTAYLGRLSAELELLSPRPILPQDFAVLARNVAGVDRATAINGLNPGRTITDATLNSTTTLVDPAGSFSLADVGRAVTGTHIPASTVVSSYTNATTVVISHAATFTGTNQTVVLGDLTGVERCVTVSAVDVNGNAVGSTVQAAITTYLQGLREVNFLVPYLAPTYTQIDVTFTATSLPGQNPSTVQAAAIAAVDAFLSPANWGGGNQSPPIWDPNATTVIYLAVAGVISATPGLQALDTLQIAIHGNSLATSNVSLPGDVPLPEPGTISGTVTAGV